MVLRLTHGSFLQANAFGFPISIRRASVSRDGIILGCRLGLPDHVTDLLDNPVVNYPMPIVDRVDTAGRRHDY